MINIEKTNYEDIDDQYREDMLYESIEKTYYDQYRRHTMVDINKI